MEPAEKPLSRVPVGGHAVIRAVGGRGPTRLRLLELGLLPGTPVTVVRRAPMGDPLELGLRDYALSIRSVEAEEVIVVEVPA